MHDRTNVQASAAWSFGIVAVLIAILSVARLLRKRPMDLGEVSGRWIAQHLASEPGDSFR